MYTINYLNSSGSPRTTSIEAKTPGEARTKFKLRYPNLTILSIL